MKILIILIFLIPTKIESKIVFKGYRQPAINKQ